MCIATSLDQVSPEHLDSSAPALASYGSIIGCLCVFFLINGCLCVDLSSALQGAHAFAHIQSSSRVTFWSSAGNLVELGGIKKVETVRQNLPRDTIIWWLLLETIKKLYRC